MRKPNLFTKYIISYTALFFIPVLILGLNAFNDFNKVLNKEINYNNISLLAQAENSIGMRIEELNRLSIQVSSNPYFSRTYLTSDFQNVITAVNLLRNFNIPNNFYTNFLIYYFDQNIIYSPYGTYRPDYFSNYIFKYDNWNFEQLKDDVETRPEVFVRPSEKVSLQGGISSEKYITYVVPLPYLSDKPTGAILFTIQESTIYNMLKETLASSNGNVLILDNKSNPIAMLGDLDIGSIDLSKFSKTDEKFSEKMFINNKTYFISSVKSKSSGWTYVSFIPSDIINSKLSTLKIATFGVFISVFIVGFILIYLFMHINYKPLDELSKFTQKALNNFQKGPGEIESVRLAVDSMSRKISVLEQKVQSAEPVIKNQILQQLLKGRFTDKEEFNVIGKDYGLGICGSYYSVVILMFDNIGSLDIASITNDIDSTYMSMYSPFILCDVQDNEIILILCDECNNLDLCFGNCSTMYDSLKSKYDINCTIGIGSWANSLSDIGKSYLHASSALDYRLIKGKNTVITYKEAESSYKNAAYYPQEQVDLLEKYISVGDIQNISSVLDGIIKNIKEKNISLMAARLLCYNIIQAIIQSAYRNNYKFNEEIEENLDIVSLAKHETIEELSTQVKKICIEIFSNITAENSTTNKQIEKIKTFIHNNYCDCNFSLQSMSESVDMSVSYLSHFFKAQVNQNISDYVNDLRMTKAKKLLSETDTSLQELALSVGYVNLSSFIRKFRQTTGITPGAYRDMSKK